MDAAALFESNLALIDRVIAGVCRRAHLCDADSEDFASCARITLMENDYAVLRGFEGRSSLSTFIAVIAQRMLSDELTKKRGRWHPSREAERLGEAGIVLERIVRREQRTIDDALPIVRSIDPAVTRERLVEMERRLPVRAPRPREVSLGDELQIADAPAATLHVQDISERTGRAIRGALAAMDVEERMIVRFHFGSGLTLADISEMMRLPQRPLYRRMESILKRLRAALAAQGIDRADFAELVTGVAREMNFGLSGENPIPRRTTGQAEP
jgi:RNA polymerase sigma factor (sigma-70 family)